MAACLAGGLAGCAAGPRAADREGMVGTAAFVEESRSTSLLGDDSVFSGSPLGDVGLSGLFPVRSPQGCQVAVLAGGEDSFAVRMQSLKRAKKSIRVQALVFKGDEAGLRIAEVLKHKKAEGLDVRVIVDAFSNPWLQTQWMFFDLKQHGVEVEGYEALALQWLNELPIPKLVPHADAGDPNRRYHEKMWIIDGGTDAAVAVVGGLNVGNEYFRVDPSDPDAYWRDQDVLVTGDIVADLVAAFDRNFDHFVGIKRAKGLLNTNLYWDATRTVLDKTGKVPVHFKTDPALVARVAALEAGAPRLDYRPATCRFLQSRPRLKETYIEQAYLKLVERARDEVLIANAYFVPTPAMRRALEDAAKRCVSVKVISNSPQTNDLPEISMVGRGYYETLLAVNDSPQVAQCRAQGAALRIYEWVGQAPEEAERRQGTMHSKYAVVDGVRSLVGSYNLDPRSEKLNSETALVFEERALSAQLRKAFLENDLRYSREVTREQAATFAEPGDVVYRFRKTIGQFFEGSL
ncbi:MAG: phosphatidylserine/phosphatidylglycerophosphate/cardiolipin synthase family protein [Steroidobacteraceae bacterium]|jgi:phosphatidylserine/phosphatidylglycerophosphate/cardiolipin synthase-like enzyme|nr:phosphatidylserine/phosphatidylglycerophosphate/cardiolipin synthase family protein [Steroidobacteraceae bacterium]